MSTTDDATTAGRTLVQRLAAAIAGLSPVTADGRNTHDGYSYSSVHQIAAQAAAALSAQELVLVPHGRVKVIADDHYKSGSNTNMHLIVVRMRWRVLHPVQPSDREPVAGVDYLQVETIGEAADRSDKAYGKAMQYARKMALIQVLNLATGDKGDDPDAQSPEARGPRERQQQRRSQPPVAKPPARAQTEEAAKLGAEALTAALTKAERTMRAAGALPPEGEDDPDLPLILTRIEEAMKEGAEKQAKEDKTVGLIWPAHLAYAGLHDAARANARPVVQSVVDAVVKAAAEDATDAGADPADAGADPADGGSAPADPAPPTDDENGAPEDPYA